MDVLGIDHLGIVVWDLEQARQTYAEVLGLPITGGEELPDRGLKVSFVDAGGTRLELIAPTREGSQVSRFLEKRGEGIHHICLRVADIESALCALKANGARLIDEVPQPGAGNTRVAFLHPKAAHGVLIELIELSPSGESGD